MTAIPKIFISYSHDTEEHKSWVYALACRLVESGVDTILDQWDLPLGSNLPSFMERELTSSDRVLVICTDNYNQKSNAGVGGVGYEKTILTAELLVNQDTTKFIPCIRNITNQQKTPTCLGGKIYLDFSDDSQFEISFKQLLHELYGIPFRPKPELGKNPFVNEENSLPSIGGRNSTDFFSSRFAKAFPGCRGIEWFKDPKDIISRLEVFFAKPFYFQDSNPIWWWRDGDMYVDTFDILSPDTILLSQMELIVDELAAVNARAYYQNFIYLRTKPSQPTGLEEISFIDKQVASRGYANEEFAIFQGRPIKRTEYDDGAAIIDGKVVDLNLEAQVRIRYLTPFNLIIAPHASPINNSNFDETRELMLNEILNGRKSLEDFLKLILALPRFPDRTL